MARFLLLHGSWHGAWCWYKVAPVLRSLGHEVVAIDLPGRGRALAPAYSVGLDRMVRAAETALSPNQRTVVVVHSRSGIVASTLAERRPDLIAQTIYLAAFMLPDRKRVLDYLPDKASKLNGQIEINRVGLWDRLAPQAYRDALYADCDESDLELARALLVREPLRPALARLKLSEGRYGSVPRAYIRLTQDQAVSLALQDRLIEDTPVERVESIVASHSAYFSQPAGLANSIVKLAGR